MYTMHIYTYCHILFKLDSSTKGKSSQVASLEGWITVSRNISVSPDWWRCSRGRHSPEWWSSWQTLFREEQLRLFVLIPLTWSGCMYNVRVCGIDPAQLDSNEWYKVLTVTRRFTVSFACQRSSSCTVFFSVLIHPLKILLVSKPTDQQKLVMPNFSLATS